MFNRIGSGTLGAPRWEPLRGKPVGSDRLTAGQRLARNQSLLSKNEKFELVLQTDGNLVLYNRDPAARDKALWDPGSNHPCVNRGEHVVMQSDGNLVIYDSTNHPCAATGTQGHPGAWLIMQDDGNLVVYAGPGATHPLWSSRTQGGHRPPNPGLFEAIGHAISKIPVVGDVVKITGEVVSGPFKLVEHIASGERLDHAFVDSLKDQVKIVKDVAPYAQTIVSLVPGVGTGIGAAIGAGAALAEGKSIDEAAKAAIKGMIPGGAIAAAAFDTALKAASGENIGKAALESSRNIIPPGPAQKAFDIGVAVATGEKLQNAVAKGITSLAPDALNAVIGAGQNAIASTPGLSNVVQGLNAEATRGAQLAAGLLSHSGMNEKAIAAFRNKLTAAAKQGFDKALDAQAQHLPWLANVTGTPAQNLAPHAPEPKAAPHAPEPPKTAPHAPEPPKAPVAAPHVPEPRRAIPNTTPPGTPLRAPTVMPAPAPGAPGSTLTPPPAGATPWGPYPTAGTVSGPMRALTRAFHAHGHRGGGHGHPVPPIVDEQWTWALPFIPSGTEPAPRACTAWGPTMAPPPSMLPAVRAALGASGGQPTTISGPGSVYLVYSENGTAVVRQCVTFS